MAEPTAELSSIASSLGQLTQRIADIAERSSTGGQGDLAHELFEVERALNAGRRRLERVLD